MKKNLSLLLCLLMLIGIFMGCAQTSNQNSPAPSASPTQAASDDSETFIFTDSAGRQVELPKNITRVAPSGSVAQMILYAIAPDSIVCRTADISDENVKYYTQAFIDLPVTGQFYGKGDLNMEALIAADPQVIIDTGDKKDSIVADMDAIQEKTGIPAIFIEATVDTYPEMFKTLGSLLGAKEQGESLAKYTEDTLALAKANSAKITDETRLSVMFATGDTGLNCNAKGSIHCGVLEAIGVDNAIEVPEVSNKGGGNTITMEQVIAADPDVILLDAPGPYATLSTDKYWSALSAVKDGKYYEIPYGPYHFLASPPSINQIIGIRWLGNLLYPDLYNYDMVTEMQSFYKLFWHYDLSEADAKALLANSTLKDAK